MEMASAVNGSEVCHAVDDSNLAVVTKYKDQTFMIDAKISRSVSSGGAQTCNKFGTSCRIPLSSASPAEYYDWVFNEGSQSIQTRFVQGCGDPSTCYDITSTVSCEKKSI